MQMGAFSKCHLQTIDRFKPKGKYQLVINGLQFELCDAYVLFLFGEDDHQDSSTKTETLEVIVFDPLV